MAPSDRSHMTFHQSDIACMCPSSIVSDKQRFIGLKSAFFAILPTQVSFEVLANGVPLGPSIRKLVSKN